MLFGFNIPVFLILAGAMLALIIASVVFKGMRGTDESDDLPPPD